LLFREPIIRTWPKRQKTEESLRATAPVNSEDIMREQAFKNRSRFTLCCERQGASRRSGCCRAHNSAQLFGQDHRRMDGYLDAYAQTLEKRRSSMC